ncbi:MAG: cell division protein FtsA [Bacillota bacterium]
MRETRLVSLDIGTSEVRIVVAEVNIDGSLHVVGVGSAQSSGIKQGVIINIEQVAQAISRAVAAAERMVGVGIKELYVGISGEHLALQTNQGVVSVADETREINDTDVERVLQAARVIALPPEREIIELIAKEFVVDGFGGIKDPRGMVGVRLEATVLIITASKTVVHNLMRCVSKAGLNLLGFVFLPLAVGEYCLSNDERHQGVVLVDIGAGKTVISYFEQDKLILHKDIPIGGAYITQDISVGLRAECACAEEIKHKHGVAGVNYAQETNKITVQSIGEKKVRSVTQLDLAKIIEPRVEEIFQLILYTVKEAGLSVEPAAGYVCLGGVMTLPYIVEVANEKLNSVRRAVSRSLSIKDPSYIVGLAMINYLHKSKFPHYLCQKTAPASSGKGGRRGSLFVERMKSWLSEII